MKRDKRNLSLPRAYKTILKQTLVLFDTFLFFLGDDILAKIEL